MWARTSTPPPPARSKLIGANQSGESIWASGGNTPTTFRLYQNHPNPFNPTTTIRFDVPGSAARVPVTLAIFSVRGERIRVLVEAERAPGTYSETWDGRDDNGVAVGSGVYFYSLRAGTQQTSRRMVLLK